MTQKKKKKKQVSGISLEERILQIFGQQGVHPLKPQQIASKLKLKPSEKKNLRKALKSLEHQNKLAHLKKNTWALPRPTETLTGKITMTPRGFAFVIHTDPNLEDTFIPARQTKDALHMDEVRIERIATRARRPNGEAKTEGQVVEVINRHFTRIPGTLKREGGNWMVEPDHPLIPHTFKLKRSIENKTLSPNLKVLIEPDYDGSARRWMAELVEVLGKVGEPGLDMVSLLHERKISIDFDPELLDIASDETMLTDGIHDSTRMDLREAYVFTIDPEDAKDHDDAVSIEPTADGKRVIIGIHIADVSHYVPLGGKVDEEARQRATSVYLVDRTIPMLPQNLTEHLCSLVPNEDRLAFSVLCEFSASGDLLSSTFTPSIIRSRERLNYDQVQDFIEGNPSAIPGKAKQAVEHLLRIARKLREDRMEDGSIDFNMPEIRIKLDAEGRPVKLVRRDSGEAYHLIEDLMLLANQEVAKKIHESGFPCIYRVHPDPDESAWNQMTEDLMQVGITEVLSSSTDMNRLARIYADHPNRHGMFLAMLRNLKQAFYTEELDNHFGLGFSHYLHFTSPIRRYPDLIVHRVLRALLAKSKAPYAKEDLAALASHCSLEERNAEEAEKESMTIKRLQYYDEQLRQGNNGPFTGIISRIKSPGMVIELEESLQNGWLPYSNFGHHLQANPDTGKAAIRGSGESYSIGDTLDVGISRVDHSKREAEFFPWDDPPNTSPRQSRKIRNTNGEDSPRQKARRGKSSPKGKSRKKRTPKPPSKKRHRKSKG